MTTSAIDWSQLWYPGPRRVFTPDEMARAGGDRPSRTLWVTAGANYALMALITLQLAPPQHVARLSAMLLALGVLGAAGARWLWQRPWRRPLLSVSGVALLISFLGSLAIRWRVPDREERYAIALVFAIACSLIVLTLWFLVVWRSQAVAGRLAAQAERDRAVEMARRLAAAQIEPHFLFNTLASLQHWVATGDARAAPLLDALVGYLRATLPMFSRPQHALADELAAVRGYLGVMAARFGPRLAWQVDVPDTLLAQPLPPGLLLTLVENAVVHGVEPRIGGGRVTLQARRGAGVVEIDIADDGDGPPPGMADGTGLANCRERLALAGGSLAIAAREGGGCLARVHLKDAA